MRILFRPLILALSVLLLFSASPAQARIDHAISEAGLNGLPVFNVQNTAYAGGALCDGTTDDAPAIQAAITAAIAAGGGKVYVPKCASAYQIATGLVIDVDPESVPVVFASDYAEIRPSAGFTANYLLKIDAYQTDVAVDSFIFNCRKATATSFGNGDSHGCIEVNDPNNANIHIRNNIIKDARGNGIWAFSTGGGQLEITGNKVNTTVKMAIKANTDATFDINHNKIDTATENGIYVYGTAKNAVESNVSENTVKNITDNNNPGTGERGNGIALYEVKGAKVENNRIDTVEYSCIRFTGVDDSMANGNKCNNAGEVAMFAEFGHDGISFKSNVINGYGLGHNGSTGGTGIVSTNYQTYFGRGVDIIGNTIKNGLGTAGILVEADANVQANTIDSPGPFGIIGGTNQYMRDVVIQANTISNRTSTLWVSTTAVSVDDLNYTSANRIYRCVTAGTTSSSEPTGTGTAITDGTVVWDYYKPWEALTYGILTSSNASATGPAEVSGNYVFDSTTKPLYGATYAGSTWTPGAYTGSSKIYLSGNHFAITAADLPSAPVAGSNAYTTDGKFRVYNGATSSWRISVTTPVITNDTTTDNTTSIGLNACAGQTGSSAAYSNTCLGAATMSAGTLTTAALRNTAVGQSGLTALTTGADNTGLGQGALQGLQTGSANVGLGRLAGEKNQTGINNTSVGTFAGQGASGQSNSYNTFVGYASGDTVTTGGGNAGLAVDSLGAVTSGSNNTGTGFASCSLVTTGSNNSCIGYNVGSVTGPTTQSNVMLWGIDNSTLSSTSNTLIIKGSGTAAISATGMNSSTVGPAITLGGLTTVPGLVSGGTKFTISGCSAGTTLGGATAGSYVSGTTGTCTVVLTMNGATGLTAPTGWSCKANDLTTPANTSTFTQTASSTTTATIAGTTVTSDVVNFSCMGF